MRSQLLDDMTSTPGEVRDLLSLAKDGELKLLIEPTGLDDLLLELDQVGNRLAFAIVLAALLMGSALVLSADVRLPLLGIRAGGIGFLLAAGMGFWLLVSIIRHGRL